MSERLEILRDFQNLQSCEWLESSSGASLNELIEFAGRMLRVPIVFVTAHHGDAHRFKAVTGQLEARTPEDLPYYQRMLETDGLVIVDGKKREEGDDLERGASAFFAGTRLADEDGLIIGTFGMIDASPRTLRNEEQELLGFFARQAVTHLALAKQAQECGFRQRLIEGIFQSEPECVKVLDRDGFVQMINAAGLEIIEAQNAEEASRHSLLERVLPEHREEARQLIQAVFTGESGRMTFQFAGLKGTIRWLELRAAPLRKQDGEILGLIGVTRDITDRVEAEKGRTEMENHKSALVHALGEVVYDWNPLADKLIWGGAFAKVLGYSEEEMGNTTESWTRRVHPDDLEKVLEEVEKARAEYRNYDLEYRFQHRDGHYCWMHDRGTISLNDKGEVARIIGVIIEISKRKNAEQALLRANERYSEQRAALTKLTRVHHRHGSDPEAMFHHITESVAETLEVARTSIWIFNATRTELSCKDLFERGTGNHAHGQEILSASCATYFKGLLSEDILAIENAPTDAQTVELARDYLIPLGITSMLNAPIRLDGVLLGVLCNEQTGAPRRWTQDEQSFAVSAAGLVAQAIAQGQHRQIEEQLRQAQKMEAVGQLAGGVAHDFNNILAIVMMQAELMDTGDLSAEARERLADIRSAAKKAANLTSQLLLFSSKQMMQPRDIDLNELVAGVARMLERIIGADISLKLKPRPGQLMARADPGMIDQILLNFAVNARDAMPKGGELIIATKATKVTREMTRVHPEAEPGPYVGFSVTDTGSGIAPDVLPRIFEPFFTTKEPGKGTGLGLATVFGIVKQHRGWMKVASEPGKGSTFEVFIPAITAATEKKPAAGPKARGGNETILLAEDDRSVRLLTRVILERSGYKVHEAANAEEAFKIWEKHRDSIQLLLTDLVMPGSVSGLQLAERVRKEKPEIRIIFTSGYSAEIAGRELELRPGENFVQKPSPPNQLLTAVRRCLDT